MAEATGPRRSARRQGLGMQASAAGANIQNTPPPRKRQRKPKAARTPSEQSATPSPLDNTKLSPKPGKKRGALAALPTTPLDVLYEIFRHVHPLDLVNLSRTTKSLRAVLLDRSAAWIWKAAIDSFPGMPKPMPGMNEPQYLSLMLDPHCYFCNSSNVHLIHWALRRRCCKPCFRSSKNFIPTYALDKMLSKKLVTQAEPLLAAFRGLSKDFKGTYYLVSEVKEVMRALTTLANKPEAMQSFKDKRAAIIQIYAQRSQGIISWVDWHMMSRSNHKDDLIKVREDRITAITQRLSGLGWAQEFQLMHNDEKTSFQTYKHVKALKPLTDKAWNSMKDDMIEVMVELKELRLERSTLEAAKARIDKARPVLQATEAKRHWADPNPNDADLFSMPEFADVFARPVLDDGTDTVTQEEINTALIALPNIVEGWTMRNKQYLANLLPRSSVKSRGKQAAAKEILRVDLANSFFRCSTCVNQGRRNYTCHSTTILHHRDWFYRANPDSRVSQAFGKVFGELTWNWNEGIAYDKEASAAATDIVTLCGLDPSTATLADMDRLNKRLICDGCQIVTRENEHQRRTYAWREAVEHACYCKKLDFQVLDDKKSKEVLLLEYNNKISPWNNNHRCKHCPDSPKRLFEDTITHLKDCHNIEQYSATDHDTTDSPPIYFITRSQHSVISWDYKQHSRDRSG